ncbi:hypothetical protein Ahy_B06g084465 [Arachis hypogaea]|uniref:Ribulose bisphosphate carboxylase large subunit C-terminal domain-containing protein n=1 Tax=Arachis hypogaea TaxID=3818 RepID=A0A444YRY5_ARAHY|nr:hypothetical protein Ahy_B06g084465 [Arachis hypogaea]
MHFNLLAKVLYLSDENHIHSDTVVSKLEGKRDINLGFVDLLHDNFIEKYRSRGIYFTHSGLNFSTRCYSYCFRIIHIWHMPTLTEIFGDDSVLRFSGETLGHP